MLLVLRHFYAEQGTRLECVGLPLPDEDKEQRTYETVDGTLCLSWSPSEGTGPARVEMATFLQPDLIHVHLACQPLPCTSTEGTVWPSSSERIYQVPRQSRRLAISNMCGTCRLQEGEVRPAAFSCIYQGSQWRREIYTLGGTLYLKRNTRELDFKGARDLQTLLAVLDLTFGVGVTVELHMLVLTGSIGAYVHLGEPCFLATHASSWCEPHLKNNDVCNCVTLENILWDLLPGSSAERLSALKALLQHVTVRAHVSRKGKLVMHLHWTKERAVRPLTVQWLKHLVREVSECTLAALRHTLLVPPLCLALAPLCSPSAPLCSALA